MKSNFPAILGELGGGFECGSCALVKGVAGVENVAAGEEKISTPLLSGKKGGENGAAGCFDHNDRFG